MVVIYSTNCAHCKILEATLRAKNIDFDIVYGEDAIFEKGYSSAPLLEVDGEIMLFPDALKWAKSKGND